MLLSFKSDREKKELLTPNIIILAFIYTFIVLKIIYLFICLFGLCWVLVAACGHAGPLVVACELLSCGMQSS